MIQWPLTWAPPAWGALPLGTFLPEAKAYASQLQAPQQTDLRRYPQRPTEMSWSWPWKCHALSVTRGKVEVPSAKCLESGGIKACPSWICLQPSLPAVHLHVLFWSLSWLIGNTTSNHTLRAGTFQKVAGLTNIQETSYRLHSHLVLKCYKAQQVIPAEFCVPNLLVSWKTASARSCLSLSELLGGRRAVMLFPINTTTSLLLTPRLSHRNPMPCMSCRWIAKPYISLEAFSLPINNIFHRLICNSLSEKAWHGCHVSPQACSCPELVSSNHHFTCMQVSSAKTLIWTPCTHSEEIPPPFQHVDFNLPYGKRC